VTDFTVLPAELPAPQDDGAAAHLVGLRIPSTALPSTTGGLVDLATLTGATVVYVYPMTGVPGAPQPDGWDLIPGARGCTAEACDFRDHFSELTEAGASAVFGLSTQTSDYQREAMNRLHLPFALLSDATLALADSLTLPTFGAGGMRLYRRLTLIVRGGFIEHVFYPVFPPNTHAAEVIAWLRKFPSTQGR
jgi:peroxiredoxin